MKKLIYFLAINIFFIVFISTAQAENIKSNLISAKVFLRGAELVHNANVKVFKGTNDIVLSGFAMNIDQNSLNVAAKGDLVILAVSQRINFLESRQFNPLIKTLGDSLEILNNDLAQKQISLDIAKAEIDLIFANRQIGGTQTGVSLTELQKIADFTRKRLSELKNNMHTITGEMKKIQKKIDRINNQLKELNSDLNKPVNEIVVTVLSKIESNVEFSISYITYDASWKPIYDIRVDKINEPARLNYKANVVQNTGLDWKDLNIILSTRNPVQNNNKPELYPWFIDFERPVFYRDVNEPAALAPVPKSMAVTIKQESLADYIDVNETQLSTEFIPSIKYTIPSDNKPHSVAIQEYSVPANYSYYAVPKFDNNAFLVANLTKWNEYSLLPGSANIYFENSFVGNTFINPQTSKDTLKISLGRDQNVEVTKQPVKDYTEDKFLSSDVERMFAFDIVVKNNKNIPVTIIVEEQIPISMNEEIIVKPIDLSNGKLNSENGKLIWNVSLDPAKSTSKKLIYSVRYPKDSNISGL